MINRRVIAVIGIALASLIVLSSAHASEIDQATKLTFSRSVQIPGRVLPAGTYWFVVEPLGSDVVRIFSEDRLTIYATLLTISAEHPQPEERTAIALSNRSSTQPEAIVTWFYPGRTNGHGFVYSKQERKEIARVKQHIVTAGY